VPKPSPKKSERDLDEWDAEIEAEFQRLTQQGKTASRAQRRSRHIGAPIAFVADVCRKAKGQAALVVVLAIYRRTIVCKSQTVTLPSVELAELGINRSLKRKALIELQRAGLIEVKQKRWGRTAQVTLKWQE
jgi:hypothetical protein